MSLPPTYSPAQHPVLAGLVAAPAVEWVVEDLAALDWCRLAELLRAVAVNAGCRLGPSKVNPDGSVHFAMLARPQMLEQQRTLVGLSAWNQWSATPESVNTFAWELSRIRERTHGVFVAPAGSTPAGLSRAAELGIEIVDAAKLAITLSNLPPDQSSFFFQLTMKGDPSTPTCPICMNRLTRVQQSGVSGPIYRPTELTFQASTVVPDPVDCDKLEVLPGCEVTFLHEVRTRRDTVISGHATGDFVCLGTFVIMPGASVSGTVAARAVDVRTGADFAGQSRILDSIPASLSNAQPAWFWRCQHPSSTPECRKVRFDPHS